MSENFNYLFEYLEKENLKVDKHEFKFQIQSHPDYPSILAIADTLTFFNIQNAVVRVDVSELELLPESFIALLEEENTMLKPQLYFVEQKKGVFFCTKDKKEVEVSESSFQLRWNGIVLLIEKEEIKEIKSANNRIDKKMFWVLQSFLVLLVFLMLILVEGDFKSKLFIIFPILGSVFSIVAFKDLFGVKSELIDSFCNIKPIVNCSAVVNSKKWKVLNFIDLRSLSIVFYFTQFIGLFLFLMLNSSSDFFCIQKILLFGALPLLIMSIYYQKKIERKWCPICLAIASILVLELSVIILFWEQASSISLKSITLFLLLFFTITVFWIPLREMLFKQKELKEFQLVANRFIRNYELFKNSLVSKNRFDLPNSPIVLGNKESDTEITIISSPFCGHCEDAHNIVDEILFANYDKIKVKILFNSDFNSLDADSRDFFRILLAVFLEKGEEEFLEALKKWFETKDLKKWLKIYALSTDNEKLDLIYKQQNQWCRNNDFNFTPVVFVNGFQYPKAHMLGNLEYFVSDLVEDDLFELV